jgi:hypothetical protein
MDAEDTRPACPACGGAGGGPFGRAGGAWDKEDYVCPRCEGLGVLIALRDSAPLSSKPGVVKVSVPAPGRKRAAGDA